MKKEYQIWSLIRVSTDDATLKYLEIDYKEQVLHGRYATYKEARDAQLELVVDAVYNYTESQEDFLKEQDKGE